MKRAIGLVSILAAAAAASCVVGAPTGFSKGDSWTFPLVGPLEDGPLVTPVMIDDKGPYLFAIDPDAPISSMDEGVAAETKPYTAMGPRYDDEQDGTHPTHIADIMDIKIADLDVQKRTLWVVPVGTFNVDGRQIRGVIGHDIITDGTIFGFDRDAGVAYLSTPKGFTAPANAQVFGYRLLTSHLNDSKVNSFAGGTAFSLPPGRRVADVAIDGQKVQLHIDLGAVPNQLRDDKWGAAKLSSGPAKVMLVDEVGAQRIADHAGVAQDVAVGGITAHGLKFVPYDDRRWEREDIDGTLGLDFFRQVSVWLDLNSQKVYMVPRANDVGPGAKARIDRWASKDLAACAHPACFSVEVVQPFAAAAGGTDAPGAGPAGAVVHIGRDASAIALNIEVVLEAVDKDGKPLGKPYMIASFPAGAQDMTTRLDPAWGDATLRVVDASPFVRQCPTPGQPCLFSL